MMRGKWRREGLRGLWTEGSCEGTRRRASTGARAPLPPPWGLGDTWAQDRALPRRPGNWGELRPRSQSRGSQLGASLSTPKDGGGSRG